MFLAQGQTPSLSRQYWQQKLNNTSFYNYRQLKSEETLYHLISQNQF